MNMHKQTIMCLCYRGMIIVFHQVALHIPVIVCSSRVIVSYYANWYTK